MARNKKRSRITRPNDGGTKGKLIGFRCDKELLKLMANVPNRSETMTEALREYFKKNHIVTCSACNGRGVVTEKKTRFVDVKKTSKPEKKTSSRKKTKLKKDGRRS